MPIYRHLTKLKINKEQNFLYDIFKDADSLDRFRFLKNQCDESQLRTEIGKLIVPLAKAINEQ